MTSSPSLLLLGRATQRLRDPMRPEKGEGRAAPGWPWLPWPRARSELLVAHMAASLEKRRLRAWECSPLRGPHPKERQFALGSSGFYTEKEHKGNERPWQKTGWC